MFIGNGGDDFLNYGGGYVESNSNGCVAWVLYAALVTN